MSPLIHYCEADPGRRAEVLKALEASTHPVKVVDDLAAVPAEATIVLAGVTDLCAELSRLKRLIDARADRQVLLLWEGQDPGLLIDAIRAGVRDVLIAPSFVPEAVSRACERVPAAASAPARPKGHVVVVFSLKGGIGKSTLTANLAIAMRRASGLPTTAVDLSLPYGNLEMYLDVQPTRCVGDLLAAGPGLESAQVTAALASHPSGVRVLAGPRAHAVEALTRYSVAPILDALGADGGLTLVDLGSFLELAHASVLEAADLVVVPVTPLISSLGTLSQAREILKSFGVPADRVLPVLNHAGPDTAQLMPDVIAKLMGGKPQHVLPWGGADVAASLNEGLPVVLQHPESPLALAIDGLARDCLDRLGLAPAAAPAAAPAPKPSPFAWLTGLFTQKGVAHVHP